MIISLTKPIVNLKVAEFRQKQCGDENKCCSIYFIVTRFLTEKRKTRGIGRVGKNKYHEWNLPKPRAVGPCPAGMEQPPSRPYRLYAVTPNIT